MKKIVSRLLPVLAGALLCLCLTGCHGSRGLPAFEAPEEFDSSKNYEITFWAKNDTNKTQIAIYQKAIADFQKLYPNISVSLRLYTDYGRIYNDVITNIATNTTPNVCITYPDHIATYLTGANTVAPLDGLMASPRYGLGGTDLKYDPPGTGKIRERFLSEGVIDGVSYAIPFMRSTEACYVNRTYVEKLGFELPEALTWDFVWEVSEAATEKNADGTYKINGQNVMIPFIYKSTDNMMIQLLRQKGAGYSTPEGEVEIFNDTTREILYEIAEHTKSGAFSTFKISSYPANFLNAGQCIFAVDSTAGATWMGSDAPLIDIPKEQLVPFETAVCPVPQEDPEHPVMISQGPSVCIFNKTDPQEVLASWLFAQYLLTNEVQIAYAETEGYIPVTETAQTAPEYLDYLERRGEDAEHYRVKIDATRLFLANIENSFTTPVYNGSASLRDAAGQMIENVARSVRRRETVDDAYMEKMFGSVRSLYRLDQKGASSGSREEMGPLPAGSRALLTALVLIWAALAAAFLIRKIREKRLMS